MTMPAAGLKAPSLSQDCQFTRFRGPLAAMRGQGKLECLELRFRGVGLLRAGAPHRVRGIARRLGERLLKAETASVITREASDERVAGARRVNRLDAGRRHALDTIRCREQRA